MCARALRTNARQRRIPLCRIRPAHLCHVYPTVAFKGLYGRQALCENRRIAAANEVLTKLQTLGRAQPLCWAKLNCKVSLALVKS
eukprot:COSAG01_NODE_3913_length_5545_cov_4.588505_4_plen_85_part_00